MGVCALAAVLQEQHGDCSCPLSQMAPFLQVATLCCITADHLCRLNSPPPLPPPPLCRAAQEPQNAHSHLLSMVLGNSETVPVTGGKLALGQWQVDGGIGISGWQQGRW